jgi:hypothetical protein
MLTAAVALLLTLAALGLGYPSAYALEASRQIFNPLSFFEYTFEVDGAEIFPNDTIKRQTVDSYQESEYNVTKLEYDIMGYHINASDVQIHVDPARVDKTKTRLDLQIYAEQVEVTGGANKYYDKVDLNSIYGIYDKSTDKIEMHVPLDVALSYGVPR